MKTLLHSRLRAAPCVIPIISHPNPVEAALRFRIAAHQAVIDGRVDIVADATGLRWLTAAGAGALAAVSRLLESRGGALKLAGSSPVRKVLAATGLDTCLPVYGSVEEARRSTEASLQTVTHSYRTQTADLPHLAYA